MTQATTHATPCRAPRGKSWGVSSTPFRRVWVVFGLMPSPFMGDLGWGKPRARPSAASRRIRMRGLRLEADSVSMSLEAQVAPIRPVRANWAGIAFSRLSFPSIQWSAQQRSWPGRDESQHARDHGQEREAEKRHAVGMSPGVARRIPRRSPRKRAASRSRHDVAADLYVSSSSEPSTSAWRCDVSAYFDDNGRQLDRSQA
jgi:hypothetical protein